MANRQSLWGLIVAVTIMLACGAWIATRLEWRDETTRSGFTDEARRNPYYAGMLLLTQSGYPTRRLDDANALEGLSARSTLLLDSPALFNTRKQAAKLLEWVQRGGHLVLPLRRRSDPDVLLSALGIRPLGWNEAAVNGQAITVERSILVADLNDAVIFDLTQTPDWTATLTGYFDIPPRAAVDSADDASQDENQPDPQRLFHTVTSRNVPAQGRANHAVYARWKLAQGYVTVGDFAAVRNDNIGKHDHAELFAHLMTLPQDVRPVYVALTAEYPGLAQWLAGHAAEALIALAALLAALLWRAMPRFGPPLTEAAPKRPGLLQHLDAVGDFLLREKQYEALIAPLREDVVIHLGHLRSRHPEIGSLPELGAHIAQLDVREVQAALTPTPRDAHEFQRRSRTLATLRKHCSSMQNTFSPEGNSR